MKFRNPWIDPRVLQVKISDAEAYLAQHGWEALEPITKLAIPYQRGADGPIVNLPQLEDAIDYPQRVIDLVAALAFAENRWAVEVLADLLQAKSAPNGGNGAAAEQGVGSGVA